MRILTVRQPWAWAIMCAGKDVENRSRNLAGAYRGPIAIHAGLAPYDPWGEDAIALHQILGRLPDPDHLYFGAVIGIIDLGGVHYYLDEDRCWGAPRRDMGLGPACSRWAASDCFHLELADPRPFHRPIPAQGALGLWKPKADLAAAITTKILARGDQCHA